MSTFSYFNKPISEVSDDELLSWYVMFLNGGDFEDEKNQRAYKQFKEHMLSRSQELQDKVAYLEKVI